MLFSENLAVLNGDVNYEYMAMKPLMLQIP